MIPTEKKGRITSVGASYGLAINIPHPRFLTGEKCGCEDNEIEFGIYREYRYGLGIGTSLDAALELGYDRACSFNQFATEGTQIDALLPVPPLYLSSGGGAVDYDDDGYTGASVTVGFGVSAAVMVTETTILLDFGDLF